MKKIRGNGNTFFDLELERHKGSIVLTSNLNKKDNIENLLYKGDSVNLGRGQF